MSSDQPNQLFQDLHRERLAIHLSRPHFLGRQSRLWHQEEWSRLDAYLKESDSVHLGERHVLGESIE